MFPALLEPDPMLLLPAKCYPAQNFAPSESAAVN